MEGGMHGERAESRFLLVPQLMNERGPAGDQKRIAEPAGAQAIFRIDIINEEVLAERANLGVDLQVVESARRDHNRDIFQQGLTSTAEAAKEKAALRDQKTG